MRDFPKVRVAAAAILLAGIVLVLPRDRLLESFRHIPPLALAGALVLYVMISLTAALKWHLVINEAHAGLNLGRSLHCYCAGMFVNTFSPSVIGGEAVIMTMALARARNRAGVLLGSALNRLVDATSLTLLVGGAALLLPRQATVRYRGVVITSGILILTLALAGMAAFVLIQPERFPARIRETARTVREALHGLSRPVALSALLVLGILVQVAFAGLAGLLGAACGLRLAVAAWMFAWPLAKLCGMLPITPAGIGVREIALTAFLAPFGVPAAQAVAVGLAYDAIMLGGGLAQGAISYVLGRRCPQGTLRPADIY